MENAYTGTSMNNYKSHAAWVVKEPSAAEDSNKLICYVNHCTRVYITLNGLHTHKKHKELEERSLDLKFSKCSSQNNLIPVRQNRSTVTELEPEWDVKSIRKIYFSYLIFFYYRKLLFFLRPFCVIVPRKNSNLLSENINVSCFIHNFIYF